MDERNGGGVHTSLLDCVTSFFFVRSDVLYVVKIKGFLSAQFSLFLGEKREKKAFHSFY